MTKTRRSSLQVQLDYIADIKQLEAERKALEKDAKDRSSPVHWAAIKAIAQIVLAIAAIVRQIKKRRKRK